MKNSTATKFAKANATKARKATKTNADAPVIIVDTREQEPFAFTGETVEETLATGDYSVKGLST